MTPELVRLNKELKYVMSKWMGLKSIQVYDLPLIESEIRALTDTLYRDLDNTNDRLWEIYGTDDDLTSEELLFLSDLHGRLGNLPMLIDLPSMTTVIDTFNTFSKTSMVYVSLEGKDYILLKVRPNLILKVELGSLTERYTYWVDGVWYGTGFKSEWIDLL